MSDTAGRGARFDPMSGSWGMVFADLVVVVGLACVAKAVSDLSMSSAVRWTTFIGVVVVLIWFIVAMPLRVLLMRQRRVADATTEQLRVENERQEFDARYVRALDMVDNEAGALKLAARALADSATGLDGSILLADHSDAHLQTVMTTEGIESESICDVASPRGCPAIRNGHILEFRSSDQIDCCPHLLDRGRPDLAALCIPVSVVGKATGVVHAVRRGRPFDVAETSRIRTVARLSGQRVGVLRATEQSLLQASTDPLTGLSNRRSMENAVRALVHDKVPFAVGMCDLDLFKVVNDTYGHDTGDRALRVFSRTLRNTVRAGDLVSRHGGEEFVVVLPYSDGEEAEQVLDRVRLELAVALSDGRTPAFTVSAGIADTTEGSDYQDLLVLADDRLLAAKRAGRNRVLRAA